MKKSEGRVDSRGRFSNDVCSDSEDIILKGMHGALLIGVFIVPSRQMQKPMNHIEGKFAVDVVAKLGASAGGGVGADENLAVVKRDYVGRLRIAKEISVNATDLLIGYNGNLYFSE